MSKLLEKGPQQLGELVGSLKHRATDILEPPCFHRGFVWSHSDSNHISPSALYTKAAPPLPAPPQHLLDDPKIQDAIHSLGDAIIVKTPFDIEKFDLLLADHLNQPFVKSVMKGLHKDFWPFDEGEWKVKLEEVIPSYKSNPEDAEVIQAFQDQEIAAG